MSVYGLLGRSLAHSYSPAIHRALGGYDYRLFEVEPEGLADFLHRADFAGINVTIPYKREVIPFCRALSPTAAGIGSVNTLLRRPDGSLFGENTDAAGFRSMVERSGVAVAGKKALVLGSGGSSLTVTHVLKELGAGEVVVLSRGGKDNYQNLDRQGDAEILINTTPVGMYPETDAVPVDLAAFPRLKGVLDLIYNPARTRLLTEAAERGIPQIGGLAMLVGQARAACELFLGSPVDAQRERAVLRAMRTEMENVILVGMPGCGKSAVGRLLAQSLGRPFVDADRVLEESAGMSIPDMFAREGEGGFRRRERAVLREVGRKSGLVISTGGGCVTSPENFFALRQNGVVVFLERELDRLAREGRPLSSGDLAGMYERRLPLYRRFADLCIPNDGSLDAVVKKTLEGVYAFFGD